MVVAPVFAPVSGGAADVTVAVGATVSTMNDESVVLAVMAFPALSLHRIGEADRVRPLRAGAPRGRRSGDRVRHHVAAGREPVVHRGAVVHGNVRRAERACIHAGLASA